MAFCSKCGTQVNDDAKFCPKCGAAMETQTDYAAKIASLNNTSDTTAEFDKADVEQNKIMAVLAYISWLVLIPIFAAPNSKFARYHANQGLVLLISEAIYSVLFGTVSAILFFIHPILSAIWGILGIVSILFLILAIIGIVNVCNGKAKELPIIGKIRILK